MVSKLAPRASGTRTRDHADALGAQRGEQRREPALLQRRDAFLVLGVLPSATGARSASSTARWRPSSGSCSSQAAGGGGQRAARMPASCARPSASGSAAATERHGALRLGACGRAPQSHRLFTAGSPRASRASFTGCACSSIWISVSSASSPPPRARRRGRRLRAPGCPAKGVSSASRATQRAGSSAWNASEPAKCRLSAATSASASSGESCSASPGTTISAVAHARAGAPGRRAPTRRRRDRCRRPSRVSAPAASASPGCSKASLQPLLQRQRVGARRAGRARAAARAPDARAPPLRPQQPRDDQLAVHGAARRTVRTPGLPRWRARMR